jgi:hypothetical protein
MQKSGVLAGTIVGLVIVAAGAYYLLSGSGSGSGDKLRELVDQQIKRLPPGATATYKSIDGDRIKGFALHVAGPNPSSSADVTVDEIHLVNPNLDLATAWDKATADAKALTPDSVIPVYDSAELKGLSVRVDSTDKGEEVHLTGSVGSASSKALRLYPWALTQPGVMSLAELQAFFAKPPPSSPTLADFMPLVRFEAAMGLGYADGGVSLENLKVTAKTPTAPAPGPQEVTVEVKKVFSNGQDRGLMSGAGLEGLTVGAGSQGGASIEKVSYAGYDLRKPLAKVMAAQTFTPDMLDGLKVGKIEYMGFVVQPPNNAAAIRLGSFSISDILFNGPVPVSGGFSLQGLKVGKDSIPDPQAKMVFDQMGIDTATISMGATYEWDLAKKRIQLHDVVLKVDELGAVNLGVDVAEITPDMAGAMGAQLAHAKLTYSDASLTDRAFKMAAAMSGTDAGALRKNVSGMIQQMSAQFASSPPLAQAAKAVLDFLGAPKSLTIELSPPKPVAIMQLSMLAGGGLQPQIATMLGLSVTANK